MLKKFEKMFKAIWKTLFKNCEIFNEISDNFAKILEILVSSQ